MNIFNSIGSNYNLYFALKQFFPGSNESYKSRLQNFLEEKYQGKAVLVYKGREAIRLALRASNLKNSTVAICGFTCFAVFEAIRSEGLDVEYLDIEKDSLNFSAEIFKKAINKNPRIKAVMIQNTLGYASDIEKIAKICKENNIILVEDLAHSIGTIYKNGKEAGTMGDFVILSFSQDKMIDNVSGGALIIRNEKFSFFNSSFPIMKRRQILKDKFYPIITYKIRKTYQFGIGKALHKFAKSFNILSKPMKYEDYLNIHSLPIGYCREIYFQLLYISKNLEHRRKIAGIYNSILNNVLTLRNTSKEIDMSSNLRFPIFVENRISLINYLKDNQIYVSDIWYDAPISPKKYLAKTSYKTGNCSNSEIVSEHILNLPTHINVSENDARKIAQKINIWLKSQ